MKFKPITTKEELKTLDEKECARGYMDGFHNVALCRENLTLAYVHGWNNGQVDGGHSPISVEQILLAKAISGGAWHGNA